MEISKPALTVSNGMSPKPWRNYVREFFMLFLAVFCGFLAENYREKLADDEAEKQSMELLAKSLESDTIELAKTIKLYKERAMLVDSFISIKDLDFSLSENKRKFYKYTFLGILNSRYFKINQSGFDQLKYSGMIRQIENPYVMQRIGDYYNTYQSEILARESDYKIWYQHTISNLMKVADYSIFGGNSSGWILVFFPKMNLTNSPLPKIKMSENQKTHLS